METPEESKDETDHTLFEFVKMWASLILLSIESFNDTPMDFIKELKQELDRGHSPESLAARYNIPVENILKVFPQWLPNKTS